MISIERRGDGLLGFSIATDTGSAYTMLTPEEARATAQQLLDAAEQGRAMIVVAEPMEGFGGGFRQEWISGEADDVEVGLDTGAGLGNPYLTCWAQIGDGDRRYETIDVRPLLQAWGGGIEADLRAAAPEEGPADA